MENLRTVRPRPFRSRRWKIGILLAFYLVAFSATVPFIETGRSWELAQIHADKAAQCRRFVAAARSAGRDEESQRLTQSARAHERFAAVYTAEASRTRLTWMTYLIRSLMNLGSRFSY